jgi:hypothetical protein
MTRPGRHDRRMTLALTVSTVVVVVLAVSMPLVPRVHAVDPTPDPSATATPAPTPTPTPDPTPSPVPTPSPDPGSSPTTPPAPTSPPSPSATATPSLSPSASPPPGPSPSPSVGPSPSPTGAPSASPTEPPGSAPPGEPSASPSPSGSASAGPDESASPSPSATPPPVGLEVDHGWADTVDRKGVVTGEGAVDRALSAMERFVVYRVRFQVTNTSDGPIQLTPVLEVGRGAEPADWSTVPAVDPVPDAPFYVASDDDRVFRPRSATIPVSELRLQTGRDSEYLAATGETSAGLNPAPPITLAGRSFTEVEFAVRASVGAAWDETYAFRLQPSADSVGTGTSLAVTMRSRPPIRRTLPKRITDGDPTALAAPRYALAVAALPAPGGPRYPLAATVDPTSPHISASLEDDGCAACHAAHRSPDSPLIANTYRIDPLKAATEPYAGADFSLCITCHDESPYADTSGSANPLTNFAGHGFHLGLIEENGTGGLDITVPGDGQGNALCAECHYNLHGVPSSERGLVIFAPDVEPYDGQIVYDAATGSCTLTCHDKPHDGLTFTVSSPGT